MTVSNSNTRQSGEGHSSLRYPTYKPTGIGWLGEIPDKWDVNKIKYSTYVKGRIGWQGLKSDEFIDEGPYLVTGTDFIDGKVNWDSCYHISDRRYNEDPYIQLRNSDLLITKDGSIGKTAIVGALPGKATLNSGIFLIRCIDGSYTTDYMYYLLNSDIFKSFIDFKKSGTTISHLYQNVFVDFSYPLPSYIEQTVIVAFLDSVTARIDALIEKKEQQIGLMREKRSATISHAITKGLDPNVPMNDSGVKWIGKIPAHWKLKRLMYLTQIDRQIMYGIVLPGPNVESGVPIVKGGDVSPEKLSIENLNKTTFEIESNYKRSRLKNGDIVYAIRGSIGMAEIVPREIEGSNITQDVARIAPAKCINNKWLLFAVKSKPFFSQLDEGTNGATIRGINICDLKRAYLPVPNVDEQIKIANILEKETNIINQLIEKVLKNIDLLKEYRAALISAAVTGKIDVRGEAL